MCKFSEEGWLSVCVGGESESYSYNYIIIFVRIRHQNSICWSCMSWSILNDKRVPAHAGFGESFEDQCGEGFHVNSCLDTMFLSVEEIGVFQACTVESRCCVIVWWCSGQRLLRCVLRATARVALVAQCAQFSFCFQFPSCD